MNNSQIKEILEEVYPVEVMALGETTLDYIINEEANFSHDHTDSGGDIDIVTLIATISGSIVILKEGYEFVKTLSKDIRKRINPQQVLEQISKEESLSDEEKKELIRKVLNMFEDD